MVDEPNQNAGGDNRPRLKKVKRPVKKLVATGQGEIPPKTGMGTPPSMQNRPTNQQPFNAPVKANEADAFNLDSYLDSEEEVSIEEKRQFVTDEDLTITRDKFKFMVGNLFTLNAVIIIGVAALFFGFITAKIFSGGEKVVQDGLQGVVINQEVPRGRARCGVAERTQGCVLYIMNPQRQELNARDFYDLASQLTGRQKFVIETGNIRYSNVKIKPGAIAQFNIPPLIN